MDRVHLHPRWKNHSDMSHNSTIFPQERELPVSLSPDIWVLLALCPRGHNSAAAQKTCLSETENIVKIFRKWSEILKELEKSCIANMSKLFRMAPPFGKCLAFSH